jgi:hypothetical protein
MALDASGNVYITGDTSSPDYPATPGSYDESYSGANTSDVFISKLDSDLSSLLASTFIGELLWEYGYALALDARGNVLITGNTFSDSYPITPGAYSENFNGFMDGFVTKLDSNLSSLLASTFTGGAGWDEPRSMVVDKNGNVYVAVLTFSPDYPTMSGGYDESFNGVRDIFVSKFCFSTEVNNDDCNGHLPDTMDK